VNTTKGLFMRGFINTGHCHIQLVRTKIKKKNKNINLNVNNDGEMYFGSRIVLIRI